MRMNLLQRKVLGFLAVATLWLALRADVCDGQAQRFPNEHFLNQATTPHYSPGVSSTRPPSPGPPAQDRAEDNQTVVGIWAAASEQEERPIFEGADIQGAPSPEEFHFSDELLSLCRAKKWKQALWKLPLSYAPGTDPKDFVLTSKTDKQRVAYLAPYWSTLRPHLVGNKASIFGPQERFDSCAVVGNSGNLLKSHYGPEIDRHDRVFRFNLAPAGGLVEDFVGTKTHFRTLNVRHSKTIALNGRMKDGHKAKVPWEPHVTLLLWHHAPALLPKRLRAIRAAMSKEKSRRTQKLVVMERSFLNHTNNLLKHFRECQAARAGNSIDDLGDKVASAGVAVVLNALHLCRHVSTYGVGEKEVAFLRNHFHYFQDRETRFPEFIDAKEMQRKNVTYNGFGVYNHAAHHFTLEYELLSAMASAGALRHCTVKGCTGKALPWSDSEDVDAEGDGDYVEYDGAVIAGAPTPKNFSWENQDDVRSLCREHRVVEAVTKLPLSYPHSIDPRGLVLTTDSDSNFLKADEGIAPYWPSIKPYVTHSKADIFGPTRFESCAVVGGSGGLLKANYGPEIDRHTAVFRFNLAPAGGQYTSVAGSKTHFRMLNNVDSKTQALNGFTRMEGGRFETVQWEEGATLILSRVRGSEIRLRMKLYRRTMAADPKKQTQKVVLMDKRYFAYTANYLEQFRICKSIEHGEEINAKGDKSPSSGLVLVLNALHLCKHVTLYGIADKDSSFIRHHFHYFKDNKTALPDYVLDSVPEDDELGHRYRGYGHANTIAHHFELERQLFITLAKAGLLRHCTWEGCTGKELPQLEPLMDETAAERDEMR